MSLSGKITTISCQIDLSASKSVRNNLVFRPLYLNGCTFCAAYKDSISLILAIARSGLLM